MFFRKFFPATQRNGSGRPVAQDSGDSAPTVSQNAANQQSETARFDSESNRSGEPGVMPATLDTLEKTHAFDPEIPPTHYGDSDEPRGKTPAPVYQKTDGNAMKFTYASGSKPLRGFTIKRGVGVGGFGEVYFAISDAGKEVALKRIQRNLDIEVRGVSHCLNLKHPNLISLYDIRYDDGGQAWVVMEYVAGDSLRTALDRAPSGLTESEARRWFAALAAGVAHLHDAGIVHRDLKPGNIFSDEGIIKIGDYGLSKYISCSRKGGHTESVGTFHYMAPEVGRGDYGREIDIYAMGIVLYEMLTGTVPFEGESSHEIVMKHLTANPDLSGISEPYRSVIWQALQKNPAARQQTVAQMIRPLGMVLDEHGLVRAAEGSIEQPVTQRFVGQVEDPGIQFNPPGAYQNEGVHRNEPVARPSSGRDRRERETAGIRFGDVRYHRTAANPGSANQYFTASRPVGRREEPVARAVKSAFGDARRWWESLEPFPGTRIILLLMGIALIVVNTTWLFPLLSILALIYVPYYVLRAMMLGVSKQPSYAAAHLAAMRRPVQPRFMTVKEWRVRKRTELAAKTSGVRIAELGNSMSTAAILATAIGCVIVGLASTDHLLSLTQIVPFVWSTAVAVLGAGTILFLSKLWERESNPSFTRRVVMLGAGAAIGAAAFQLGDYLMMPLNLGAAEFREFDGRLPAALYAGDFTLLPGMMAHFAVLFAGLRWWRGADPLRTRRFSPWATAVAVVAEFGLHQFLPIPQPFGMMTAGLLSIAIQFSAPWENPKQRLSAPQPSPQIV